MDEKASRKAESRQSLLSYLQNGIKMITNQFVAKPNVPITEDNQFTILLCDAIERILSLGLIKPSFWARNEISLWNVVEQLEYTWLRNYIQMIRNEVEEQDRASTWIRWCLNEKKLVECMQELVNERTIIKTFYEPQESILNREDDCSLFMNQILVLNSIDFKLSLKKMVDDHQDNQPLVLIKSKPQPVQYKSPLAQHLEQMKNAPKSPPNKGNVEEVVVQRRKVVKKVTKKENAQEPWETWNNGIKKEDELVVEESPVQDTSPATKVKKKSKKKVPVIHDLE